MPEPIIKIDARDDSAQAVRSAEANLADLQKRLAEVEKTQKKANDAAEEFDKLQRSNTRATVDNTKALEKANEGLRNQIVQNVLQIAQIGSVGAGLYSAGRAAVFARNRLDVLADTMSGLRGQVVDSANAFRGFSTDIRSTSGYLSDITARINLGVESVDKLHDGFANLSQMGYVDDAVDKISQFAHVAAQSGDDIGKTAGNFDEIARAIQAAADQLDLAAATRSSQDAAVYGARLTDLRDELQLLREMAATSLDMQLGDTAYTIQQNDLKFAAYDEMIHSLDRLDDHLIDVSQNMTRVADASDNIAFNMVNTASATDETAKGVKALADEAAKASDDLYRMNREVADIARTNRGMHIYLEDIAQVFRGATDAAVKFSETVDATGAVFARIGKGVISNWKAITRSIVSGYVTEYFLRLAWSSAKAASEIHTLSQFYGQNTEAVANLTRAYGAAGRSSQLLEQDLQGVAQAQKALAEGNRQVAETLRALGVDQAAFESASYADGLKLVVSATQDWKGSTYEMNEALKDLGITGGTTFDDLSEASSHWADRHVESAARITGALDGVDLSFKGLWRTVKQFNQDVGTVIASDIATLIFGQEYDISSSPRYQRNLASGNTWENRIADIRARSATAGIAGLFPGGDLSQPWAVSAEWREGRRQGQLAGIQSANLAKRIELMNEIARMNGEEAEKRSKEAAAARKARMEQAARAAEQAARDAERTAAEALREAERLERERIAEEARIAREAEQAERERARERERQLNELLSVQQEVLAEQKRIREANDRALTVAQGATEALIRGGQAGGTYQERLDALTRGRNAELAQELRSRTLIAQINNEEVDQEGLSAVEASIRARFRREREKLLAEFNTPGNLVPGVPEEPILAPERSVSRTGGTVNVKIDLHGNVLSESDLTRAVVDSVRLAQADGRL